MNSSQWEGLRSIGLACPSLYELLVLTNVCQNQLVKRVASAASLCNRGARVVVKAVSFPRSLSVPDEGDLGALGKIFLTELSSLLLLLLALAAGTAGATCRRLGLASSSGLRFCTPAVVRLMNTGNLS
jgi:hypothetical protein